MVQPLPKLRVDFDHPERGIVVSNPARILLREENFSEEQLIWELKSFMHNLDIDMVYVHAREHSINIDLIKLGKEGRKLLENFKEAQK